MTSDSLPADTSSEGKQFGPYRLQALLGSGGMAEVYDAVHVSLGKRVAVKVLGPEALANDRLRQRFLVEGERAARIRHPNVVDITDVGEVDNVPFLVMELLQGETLGDRIKRDAPMGIERAVNLILPVIAATAAGHEQGVIHRDLKPENIFLARDGTHRITPKVLDFGVSYDAFDSDVENRLTLPDAVLGTPHYMSPEQARGEICDGRSDQYTIGVVLYELVTGRLPSTPGTFLEVINQVSRGNILPPSTLVPDMDSAFEAVLLKSLRLSLDDRFATLPKLGLALLEFASARTSEFWRVEFDSSDEALSARRTGRIAELVDPENVDRERSDPFHPVSVRRSGFPTMADAKRPSLDELTLLPTPLPPDLLMSASDDDSPSEIHEISESSHQTPEYTGSAESTDPSGATSRSWPLTALLLAAVIGLALFAFRTRLNPAANNLVPAVPPVVGIESGPTTSTILVDVQATPSGAEIWLDGDRVGVGRFIGTASAAELHRLELRAPGHETEVVTFRGSSPPSKFVLSPIANTIAGTTARPSVRPAIAPPQTVPSTPQPSTSATSVSTGPSASPTPVPVPTSDVGSHSKTDNRNPWDEK